MTETLKYTIIEKEGNKELRQYDPYIKAEVKVSAKGHREAISKGFNVLAAYIFGNNVTQQSINMTTPVQTTQSQKIAMTTPVTVSGSDEYTVAFVMPSEFSLSTLPMPKDKRINITPVQEHQMGTIRFSGYFNEQKIQEHKIRLKEWLNDKGVNIEGEWIIAGYNPPWVPGFLARNEVLVAVCPKS